MASDWDALAHRILSLSNFIDKMSYILFGICFVGIKV